MKFRNKQCSSNPFQHYTFTDFFCDKELADIENIKIDDHSASLDSERASNGNRFFVNKDNMWSSSALNRIVDFFLRDETINMFESESNLKIRGNYLRIELIEDREKSWTDKNSEIQVWIAYA